MVSELVLVSASKGLQFENMNELGKNEFAPGGPAFLAHTKQKVNNIVGIWPYG